MTKKKENVRVIPATMSKITSAPLDVATKRRVAGYARVSTESEEQQTSYAAQADYYTNFIKSHDDWEFVNVYTDEGISATSTKHRNGFQQMVDDALAGHIDLIVTKSVSRFARNTVDSLTTIRLLRSHGTEVFFEKENISTFDGKGELMLTIMSSMAQEESRSISENIRWGKRKCMEDGKYSLNYTYFLGYDKGEDGTLVINHEQAPIVRRIYGEFLAGKSPHTIAKELTEDGIPSPGGKKKWHSTTIRSILSNETYKGDKLLQKTFSIDFLNKTRYKNTGQVPMYYIEGDHEAIIPPETFDAVQDEIHRRKESRCTGKNIFSGRIFCGDCGKRYGRKVWHSTDKHRRIVYRCNDKYEKHTGCKTPTLDEEMIKAAFEEVLAKLGPEKEEIIGNLKEIVDAITWKDLTERKCQLEEQRDGFGASLATLEEQDAISHQIEVLENQIKEKKRRKRQICSFITGFETSGAVFSAEGWSLMVERVDVYRERMEFRLTSGVVVEV